jgi:hypothetical protein
MRKLMFLVFALAARTCLACADFSGVYYDVDGASCLVVQQTGCERLLETSHFRTARPLTIDFITDGQLRRYSVESSMQRAIHYDNLGRQVFLGLDDNNGRIDGLYEKLQNGNIHMDTMWTGPSGDTAQFESVLVQMSSLASCLQRL